MGIRRDDPTHRWRGGRVAEGGGLLNRYTVNSRIVGSNPIPSATLTPSIRGVCPSGNGSANTARLSQGWPPLWGQTRSPENLWRRHVPLNDGLLAVAEWLKAAVC